MNGNETPAPQPIPDLTLATPEPGVTDEDRNRYGVLLDHAAERGLLSPADYRLRLAELAEATSMEELQRIVTELPAFDGSSSRGSASVTSPGSLAVFSGLPGRSSGPPAAPGTPAPELDAALWASLTPASPRKAGGNPWIILAVVVVILLAAMVGLALVATHVVHTQPGHAIGTGRAGLNPLHP